MKLNLAVTARLLFVSAAWATLPLAAPLHGASSGFPFVENFQSQSLLSTQTTARWTSSGVTLGRARHLHMRSLDFAARHSGIGNSRANTAINDIAVRDMDGDGNMDVITAGAGGVLVYYIDKDADLESVEPVRITPASLFRAMAIGDFDRDGYLDVAAAGNLREVIPFMNNKGGRGVFRERPRVSNLRAMALAAEDMDGDGDLDLVLAQNKGRIVEVHLNDGVGNFSEKEDAVSYIAGHNGGLGVGDFNGDRHMDIVVAKIGGMNMFYLNDGSGDFQDRQLLNHPGTAADYRGIALGDVNSDGHLDILVGVRLAPNILYLGDGNGGFSTGSRINNRAAWTIDVELADLDGDGDLDLFEGVSRRGHRIYLNQDGVLDSEGLPLRGRTSAIAVGDVDGDGDLGMVHGRNPAELKVARFSGRRMSAPSASLFDTGRGRVVSGKVNGDEQVPRVVFLTATAVQQEHTDIEYYLSNNDGKRWILAYPGKVARFSSAGNVLRWRAELKSRSPVQTPTLTRVSIESVLQVFIDGEVFSNGQTYTETTHTITAEFKPTTATIRLMNRGEQALTVTGVETVGEVFGLEDGQGESLPHPLDESMEIEEGGNGEDIRLVFNPMERGNYASTLTISGSEGGRPLPDIKVALRGQGIGAEIKAALVPDSILARVGTSGIRTVRITNEGETPLTITSATVTDSVFSLTEAVMLPTTLTAFSRKEFEFRFKPKAPGAIATTITFISNAFNGTQTRTITGQGLAPIIEIPPPALVSVREGRRTTGEVVIRNTGDWDMDITGVTGTDEFFDLVSPTTASINGFGLMVPKESSQPVVFSFTPARNMRSSPTANIIFTSNAFNNTQTEVMLRGIGTAPEIATASASAVQFGNVRVESSTEREVVITNTGDAPLMVTSAMVTNLDGVIEPVFSLIEPGEFPQTVSTGATLSLKLRFKPGTVGNIDGILNIGSDAVNRGFKPPTVSGKGVAPEITVLINDIAASKPEVMSYHFGDVDVNGRTEARVDIDNGGGGAPLEVQSPKGSSPDIDTNRHFRMTENVLFPITVGAEGVSRSSLTLFFEPKTHGTQTTTLTFVSDSLDSTETDITLTGVGLGAEMELRVDGERLAHNTTHTIGDIRVHRSTEVLVEVHNIGNVTMSMVAPQPEHQESDIGFMLDTTRNPPGTVNSGSSATFVFQFNPDKPGTAITRVTFGSDAAIGRHQTITLKGRAVGPVISTEPDARTGVQFGDVLVGKSTDREVVITNKGDLPLVVTSAMVTNRMGVDEAALSVVGAERFPQVVSVGATLTVTLRFTPEVPRGMGGTLNIVSDAANTRDQPLNLDISGEAIAPEMVVVVTGTNINSVPADSHSVSSHNFGEVPINDSTSRRVIISNQRGKASLEVFPELEGGRGFRWQSTPSGAIVVQASESTSNLVVHFEPQERRLHSADLVFRDTLNDIHTTVTLTGRGVGAPRMEVAINGAVRRHEGDPYVFVPQRVGTTASVAVTISNLGNTELSITSIETTPTSFRFIDRPPSGISVLHPSLRERHRLGYTTTGDIGRPIAAGSSATFMLHFSPSLPSIEDNALLTIRSNDPEHPAWSLNLEGRGTSRMLRVRLFVGDEAYDNFADTEVYDIGDRVASQTFSLFSGHVLTYRARASTGFKLPKASARIRLHSMGDVPVTISGIGPVDDDANFFWIERVVQRSSEDGTWYQYNNVFFEPERRGVHTATVVISSDDDIAPEVRIRLRANGIAPGIDAQVDDFGDVPVGGSSVTEVAVLNNGDAPLTIKGVAVAAGRPFDADVVPSELPVVQPGHASTFHISFAPVELGVSTSALILRSDAFGEPEHRVVLRGNGIKPENTLDIEVGGQAMTSQAPYDFGRARVGKTTAVAVTVSNRGASGLRLKPQVEGRGYNLADSAAKTVLQDAPGAWILRFQPESRGAHQSTLTIVDVDNPLNSRAWGLTGFGHGPQIKVEVGGSVHNFGANYNFGTISYGSATTAMVKITNKGNSALNIKSVKVTPEKLEYSAHYRHALAPEAFASYSATVDTGYSLANNNIRTIPSSGSASLELRFTPVVPIANDSVLTIVSDNPDHPEWSLSLKGRGTGPFMSVFSAGRHVPANSLFVMRDTLLGTTGTFGVLTMNLGDSSLAKTANIGITGEGLSRGDNTWSRIAPGYTSDSYISPWPVIIFDPVRTGIHTGTYTIYSNDRIHPAYTVHLQANVLAHETGIDVVMGDESPGFGGEYNFGDIPVDGSSQTQVSIGNGGKNWILKITDIAVNGNEQFGARITPYPLYPVTVPSGAASWSFDLYFAPTEVGPFSARLLIRSNAPDETIYLIRLRGNGVPVPPASSNWAGGAQRPATPAFAESESDGAPRFAGLGYADWQSRLWLAFDEPAQILSGTDARVLADGAALSGFEVLPNYAGDSVVEDIGVLRARYRSGGVVMDLARGIVPADASLWARYTPPSDGVSGIYDMASPPNRIASVRLFMLPRSAVLDYDGDGFPDALEARLGGNPLVADDVVGLPEVALLRAGAVGSPAAVAYSGIRADGVAAHLGVVTTGASSLAAYYLSDTFGYSGGYVENVGGYGCTGRFPADYASPLRGGGCAVVDFNSIRAGVEHRIGWLATNAAGYWAVAEGTASRLPEMVILRVPEFNMKRRNVFVANSAAADETVVVGAFHDGPASLSPLTVSFGNVAAAGPSSREPDGFSVSVAGGAPGAAPDATPDARPGTTPGGAPGAAPEATPDGAMGTTPDAKTNAAPNITNYAITGVHSGEAGKLWLAGDPLSSLTPDKYSLGKVTQTSVVRLADDNLPPLFGRASLYAGTTADKNERHAVVVRGTENYIALLPVVQGSAQTASAFEVSPWDGVGSGPVAADDRIVAVNEASPTADGALVRIAFTASSPPATVRNTVSLEVAASSAGASTATTVLTWPVIDSADALASIAGDNDNDGIPDVRDSYRLLNRLPVSVAGGVSGYPDRSSAGADGWHHIRPLLPLHGQHVGSYATRAGLSFHTDFNGDARILTRLPVETSGQAIVTPGEETIVAPEGQSVLSAAYQPGVPAQMNYADFAASLSRGEFDAMAEQSRQDIAVVYNFRLHGVEPSVAQGASPAQGATLAGGRAGVVIPLPESLHEHTSILPLHYTNGAWSGFSTGSGEPATAGFAPLQAGACPDDSGVAGSAYRTENGVLNTRKRTGDACMVLYLTDGAAADRDGNINGIVDALIGLAATLPR